MSYITNELCSPTNFGDEKAHTARNFSPSIDSEDDVESWFSLGGQRVIQVINVKSLLDVTHSNNVTKEKSNNKHNHSYASLTSHSAVHNALLTVGIGRKSLKMQNKYMAASKIQSVVRMYQTKRQIRNTVNYLKNTRNTLIEDAIKSKGCNPKFLSMRSRFFKHHETEYIKEIHSLTKFCMNPTADDHHIKRILYLFFDICSSNKRYLERTEFTILVCDILRLPFSKDEVINYILSSKGFHNSGMVNYNQLCKWFFSYKHEHSNDKVGFLKRIINSWFVDPLPENIILSYIDIRASLFDVCITARTFDLKHSCFSLPRKW